jgi:hypothetical protein
VRTCAWPYMTERPTMCGATAVSCILAPTNLGTRETWVCAYHRDQWRAIRRLIYGSEYYPAVDVKS